MSRPPIVLPSSASPNKATAKPIPIATNPATPIAIVMPFKGFPSATHPFWRRAKTIGGCLLDSAAMPIEIDIAHVARLARLGLTDEELESYKAQLGVILEHAARVQSLEVEPDVEAAHPLGLVNALRHDEVRPSLDRDEVLGQAPEALDGHFVVPPAMEAE
jgi:aspartyl-tRNA(Asn)/glutamyl-tRNA(Gln) amidotransferase subunit C